MQACFAFAPLAAALLLAAAPSLSQEEDEFEQAMAELGWVSGPADVGIADIATVSLPSEYSYLDSDDTAVLMEMFQNPASTEEYFVGPDDLRWWAVFSFEDTGYIKDDEEIDADDLLDSLREGNRYANEERRNRGWSELHITGWQYPPFYEEDSNRLAWAIRAEVDGEAIVNYNTRLLGRKGVMSAVLVADPKTLDASVREFKQVLATFNYDQGHRYAEYLPGDKVAAYGLAALVTGGAAAAVAKSGAAKGLFKLIGVGALAVFAFFSRFAKRIFKRSDA
jgi:uncharacterized membrane-anchored protein